MSINKHLTIRVLIHNIRQSLVKLGVLFYCANRWKNKLVKFLLIVVWNLFQTPVKSIEPILYPISALYKESLIQSFP